MQKVNRRSAVALGLAAASAAMVKPAASQTTDIVGKDATPWPGVVVRVYSETPAIIPGFKNVQLRDVIMQPGSKTASPPGDECHGLPYHRGGASDRAERKDLYGQEELCLDLQQGHKRAGVQ
jgi:hypothetical protein